mmetsp:Transcript_66768/g.159711  ORF Transcript_66768/g.159711 Transcript_66768/m.159711 type:complete len:203 (+) Transcript_66768:358-966(+)
MPRKQQCPPIYLSSFRKLEERLRSRYRLLPRMFAFIDELWRQIFQSSDVQQSCLLQHFAHSSLPAAFVSWVAHSANSGQVPRHHRHLFASSLQQDVRDFLKHRENHDLCVLFAWGISNVCSMLPIRVLKYAICFSALSAKTTIDQSLTFRMVELAIWSLAVLAISAQVPARRRSSRHGLYASRMPHPADSSEAHESDRRRTS